MKPVALFAALLVCSPAAGWAQVPPASPAPPAPVAVPAVPAPPAPVVAPAPAPLPAPVAVPVPPAPPAPPVPPAPVVPDVIEIAFPDVDVNLALDSVDVALQNIDVERISAEAMRAAEDAIQHIDVDAIRERARRAVEDARQNVDRQSIDLDRMREERDRMREDARAQADAAREQAKEIAKQFEFKTFSDDFTFAFDTNRFALLQGPNARPVVIAGRGDESGQYQNARSLVERRQYEQAIVRLDQVAALKGAHADAALYWKAYAQYKLGRTDDALATIAALRSSSPQSRWLSDARVLEADVRQSAGKPLTGDADDDEIKLLAIQGLQNSNPAGAIPLLENVLTKTNGVKVKKNALFVLAQNDQPAAHQLLLRYAKGAGNPDLQVDAIRYLTARRQQTTSAELDEIYNSTQDVDVRRAVLDALISSRDRAALIRIAGSDAPAELRRRAIGGLGNDSMTAQEMYQLYQKENSRDLKIAILRLMGSSGAVEQLSQVIRNEKDADVRQQAIRSLGSVRNERTTTMLVELYNANDDRDSRRAVLSALASQNNASALVAIARKETNNDLKLDIVRRITDLAPKDKVAMDYLMELIK